ncbi:UDP-3-O-acyl-N-acetylglucosamine deacetylase [Pelagibacteraceae bacterium]|jgi:UDP-3-O-[3-hydroxymyristoyl] N-acetylglucosamine deacetylase|nr:UDP-3-O-acyl-N-acetylglucosamine deacetylase [Pelagibacteraceae bacterium]MDC0952559.1 UDP-3-O-acyl-N-acetylglucosamine deacetylase [Pelagibacteraceae bacterium]
MLEIYQKTILNPISFEGIGLHSGKSSKITIFPGQADQGIIFKRIDLKKNNLVPAKYESVTSAKLCTTLENEHGVKVSTVEHLLAALYMSEIDNAIIEIDNEEIPIMDGSAKDFLEILKDSKIKTLSKKRKYLKIINKVELLDGERAISIEPCEASLEVDFQLNYENQIIGKQRNVVNFQTDNLDDVSKSRTFCLFEDIEKIKKVGLAKGGSLENAIVVDQNKVLNDGGLRNEKEFVNHKILDLAGDFVLSGFRVLGKITCYQGGHKLTNMFLRKLLNSKSAFTSIELEEITFSKKIRADQPTKLAVNA